MLEPNLALSSRFVDSELSRTDAEFCARAQQLAPALLAPGPPGPCIRRGALEMYNQALSNSKINHTEFGNAESEDQLACGPMQPS